MSYAPKYFDHEFLQPNTGTYWTKYEFDYDLRYAFVDRESYEHWTNRWRECYSALSEEIREAKQKRKITLYRGKSNHAFELAHSWAMRAYEGRRLANRMMQMRREAKELSWEMKCLSEEAEVNLK
jgi:hypothetical protein